MNHSPESKRKDVLLVLKKRLSDSPWGLSAQRVHAAIEREHGIGWTSLSTVRRVISDLRTSGYIKSSHNHTYYITDLGLNRLSQLQITN